MRSCYRQTKRISGNGTLLIYPSRSQDAKKNPLDAGKKVGYMKKMFPEFEENIVDDDSKRTIFDVLTAASEQGYKKVNIVVGADRRVEFQNLAHKYNGDLYEFDEIDVVSAGARDPDAEGLAGMSASKLRKADLLKETMMVSLLVCQVDLMLKGFMLMSERQWVSRI